jgi:hypothetical protein
VVDSLVAQWIALLPISRTPTLHSEDDGVCDPTKYCTCSYKSESTGARVEELMKNIAKPTPKAPPSSAAPA